MQHCLQTTSTATTLSASTVRGDGGDILCREKKTQNHSYFPEIPQETNRAQPPNPSSHGCTSVVSHHRSHAQAEETLHGSADIRELAEGWVPSDLILRKQKSPSPIPLKPSSHSISKETEGACCIFQSSQHHCFLWLPYKVWDCLSNSWRNSIITESRS